MIADFC